MKKTAERQVTYQQAEKTLKYLMKQSEKRELTEQDLMMDFQGEINKLNRFMREVLVLQDLPSEMKRKLERAYDLESLDGRVNEYLLQNAC